MGHKNMFPSKLKEIMLKNLFRKMKYYCSQSAFGKAIRKAPLHPLLLFLPPPCMPQSNKPKLCPKSHSHISLSSLGDASG